MAQTTPRKTAAQKAEPSPQTVDGSAEDVTPSGEDLALAVRTRSALAQRNEQAMETFMTWCTARGDTTDEDQYAIMASVVGEIMTSGNVAELMAERSTMHARDVVGVPLILYGFEIRAGQFEESTIGFYAAMTCGRPGSDETRIITCGGTKVLAKLMMLESFINSDDNDEDWPQIFWFTEKRTQKGYGVLDIVRPQITE